MSRAGDHIPDNGSKNDKNELLLGVKYEAARLGGAGEGTVAAIEEQARGEIGPAWESDEGFVAGRNAVRAEHGLDRLGGVADPASAPAQKPWRERVRRLFGG
ncbi:hypothetical protein [Rubrobacter aplysinae]|uniref:hypothetical protein n=1 Tax=Rubrobacter aplysinae TaxID=909625 RepID=UPI00064BD8CC|nr:hypothetical protein [Rubrobacter aplysinae]